MTNQTSTPIQSIDRLCDVSDSKIRLTGSKLLIARIVWLALVIPSIALFITSLPMYYMQLQKACVDVVTCNLAGALTAQGLQGLPAFGLSASSYAALLTIFFTIIVTIWCGIGLIIFWRRSDEWFALVTAFFLVMFNITYLGFATSALALVYPALTLPITFLSMLGLASLAVFLVLFPNGKLVPRWMGLFLLLAMFSTVQTTLPPTFPFNSNNIPWWIIGPFSLIVFGTIIFSQIYRYKRVSTPVECQQTKWVVFGIIAVLVGNIAFAPILNFFFPQSNSPAAVFAGLAAYPIVLLSIPVSVGFAILRYQLYEIDRIINRTLVYGILTVILLAIYFGLIFAIQFLLSGILTRNNDVAIVISTLAIYALFWPLRRRIQKIIDRRFDRSKYDAAKIIANFSSTLRQEIDLDTLQKHLVGVVQETMQPAHVSLWLRKPEHEVKHK